MKTVEELEAELETVTRERDRSLFAWESAGMTGRTAQSAMLELTRQLEEACAELAFIEQEYANERNEALTEDALCLKIAGLTHQRDDARTQLAMVEAWHEQMCLSAERGWAQEAEMTRERDEARAESAKWKAGFEEFRSRNTDLMMHLFEAQEKVRAVNIEPMLHLNAQLRSKVHGLSAEVERLTRESATLNAMLDGRMPDTWREDIETLTHQLADATNESTHFQVMCKRETEEVERLARQVELLTDERDELLVRVANQDAELRATREAYRDAYRRGAEAMREACIAWARAPENDWEHLAHEMDNMPIPEEP